MEAKVCRGCLKIYGKEILNATGMSLGLTPEIVAASGALEESSVSDCNLVVPSPSRVGKSQTCPGIDLDA